MMSDHKARNGTLGAILGALIAVAFAIFLLSGGEHVGKKTVNSDADLPPIAKGTGK
jgi:predicted outer membrane lipoprotein